MFKKTMVLLLAILIFFSASPNLSKQAAVNAGTAATGTAAVENAATGTAAVGNAGTAATGTAATGTAAVGNAGTAATGTAAAETAGADEAAEYYKASIQLTDNAGKPINLNPMSYRVHYKNTWKANSAYVLDGRDWKVEAVGSYLQISIKDLDDLTFYIWGSTAHGQIFIAGLIPKNELSLGKTYQKTIKLSELCKLTLKSSAPAGENGTYGLTIEAESYKEPIPAEMYFHSWSNYSCIVNDTVYLSAGTFDIAINWQSNLNKNNLLTFKLDDIEVADDKVVEFYPDGSYLIKYTIKFYPLFREYHYLTYSIYGNGVNTYVRKHYCDNPDFDVYLSPNINPKDITVSIHLDTQPGYAYDKTAMVDLYGISENNIIGKNMSIRETHIYSSNNGIKLYADATDDEGHYITFRKNGSPKTMFIEVFDKEDKLIHSQKAYHQVDQFDYDLPYGSYTAKVYPNDFTLGINYYTTYRINVRDVNSDGVMVKKAITERADTTRYITDYDLNETTAKYVLYVENNNQSTSNEYNFCLVAHPAEVTGLLGELPESNPEYRLLDKFSLNYGEGKNFSAQIEREFLKNNRNAAILIYEGEFLINIIELNEYHPYEDIGNHWSKESIKNLTAKCVVFGRDPNNFFPYSYITRAEFAAFLSNALELQETAGGRSFSDVPVMHPQYGHIMKAVVSGLINGYPDGKFRPNDFILRQDAAMIVRNAFKIKGIAGDIDYDYSTYADIDQISPYAAGAVKLCMAKGIIGGLPGYRIAPKDFMSRAEAVVIIERFLDAVD
ncbi:MAG: S-layer homology domain-containing protein [Eubacteriales bacterium]|nr:S-layer homology domain-containing protein [Eubacteriales bacterium]